MKKSFLFALCSLSVVLLLLLTGCKKDAKQDPETFASDKARPEWKASGEQDMTSSMTAIIQVDLKAQYPSLASDYVLDANDLLAAFAGEQCISVAQIVDGLFFLYINGSDAVSSTPVTLRYYSTYYKNLFEAKDAFPFQNDDHLGTASKPYIPNWTVL